MSLFSCFWKVLLGVFIILLALTPVVHFKGITVKNLELSGEKTPSLKSIAESYSDRAIWSASHWLYDSSNPYPPSVSCFSRIIGGEDSNFNSWADADTLPFTTSTPTTTLFLQNSFYDQVGAFLKDSKRSKVRTKLRLLEINHYKKFYPFESVAGAPLGAAVYITGMLDEGNWLSLTLSQELDQEIKDSLDTSKLVSSRIEPFLLGLVAYGRIMDYSQLATWLECFPDLDSFISSENWYRKDPNKVLLFYRCLQLYPEPQKLWDYLQKYGLEKGTSALEVAIGYGSGAVKLLLQSQKAVYYPPSNIQGLLSLWPVSLLDKAYDLANRFPNEMLFIKLLLLFLGVFLSTFTVYRKSKQRTLLQLVNVVILSALSVFVFVLIGEPKLIESSKSIVDNKQLPYVDTSIMSIVDSSNTTLQGLDMITLYSLVFFFLIQLVVYLLGVIKVQEIKKHSIPLDKKIELLENEEPLFDIGLYFGLGGTVFSLILLAMGVVEASLIAAYASTLFGILGVAILKVFHVRPFRRKLILQI